ncbi:MAG: sensor histidine kinase [Rhodospirillales bacterium]|nr:sensor histidine kinase [Rhodospirillales bacterium]
MSPTEPSPEQIEADVAAIGRISAVPKILEVVAATTGMRFTAVARVTQNSWTVCAVLDRLDFGLKPGGTLDVATTLCADVRDAEQAIIIENVATDLVYRDHATPVLYGFQSYFSVPIFRTDGSYFGTICGLDPAPAKLRGGKTEAMIELFAQLIAAQLEVEEQLGESRDALSDELRTGELRETFIAVLGHDLRNPLFSIESGADLLSKAPLDAGSRTVLDLMKNSCRRMSVLVQDILDFARGRQGGGIPLAKRTTNDLDADLRQVMAELQIVHPDRLVRVDFDLRGAVTCDPARVGQLFSNLLANAMTHGAPDQPVDVLAHSANGALTLSVTSRGVPIAPHLMPRLFHPYARPSTDRHRGGLGLGLYIASKIAEAHGGELLARSDANATVFTFRLPSGTRQQIAAE